MKQNSFHFQRPLSKIIEASFLKLTYILRPNNVWLSNVGLSVGRIVSTIVRKFAFHNAVLKMSFYVFVCVCMCLSGCRYFHFDGHWRIVRKSGGYNVLYNMTLYTNFQMVFQFSFAIILAEKDGKRT